MARYKYIYIRFFLNINVKKEVEEVVMRNILDLIFILFVVLIAVSNDAYASEYLTINAKANIFWSGKSAQSEDGISPTFISFSSQTGQYCIFSNIKGDISAKKGELPYHDADGGDNDSTNILSYDGISGIVASNRYLFFVGMFADDTEPTEPAPDRLEYTTYDFKEISPELNQIFFIGDGLTGNGSGEVQKFNIPPKATRLFLGFADAYTFKGQPCCYYDNDGDINVTLEIVESPEEKDDDGGGGGSCFIKSLIKIKR